MRRIERLDDGDWIARSVGVTYDGRATVGASGGANLHDRPGGIAEMMWEALAMAGWTGHHLTLRRITGPWLAETIGHRDAPMRTPTQSRAWMTAAADIGLEVTVGTLEASGLWAIRVEQFGSAHGTVLRHMSAPVEELASLQVWADERGVFRLLLGDGYLAYQRALFIETLDDWGWHHDEPPPDWYTGSPWGGSTNQLGPTIPIPKSGYPRRRARR